MGYFSLVEFSHDQFDRIQKDPAGFVQMLSYYMNSGNKEQAERLSGYTGDGARVITMRHSSDNYIISNKTWGFPAKLPFDEERAERDEKNLTAVTEAFVVLGEPKPKKLTIAKLLDCIQRLVSYNIPFLGAVKAMKEADVRATKNLSNPNWQPGRAQYEQLRNALRQAHKVVED